MDTEKMLREILSSFFKSSSQDMRVSVVEVWGHEPTLFKKELTAAIADRDPIVRQAAVWCFQKAPGTFSKELSEAYKDYDTDVRWAVVAAWRLYPDVFREELKRAALYDKNGDVRQAAKQALSSV